MFKCSPGETYHPDHAVLIVGYGMIPRSGQQYFIVKNSFGDQWGQKGYAKISIKSNDEHKSGSCGILSYVAAPVLY